MIRYFRSLPMRLYHSSTTPFGRKVMVLLLEAGIADQVDIESVYGTPLAPANMPISRNPLGKIPALERDSGETIYDSRVICRYLDDLTGVGVYPAAPKLWETLTLEATSDGILDAGILPLAPRGQAVSRMDRGAMGENSAGFGCDRSEMDGSSERAFGYGADRGGLHVGLAGFPA
jgi:glutathione S-transferase